MAKPYDLSYGIGFKAEYVAKSDGTWVARYVPMPSLEIGTPPGSDCFGEYLRKPGEDNGDESD